MKNFRVFFPAKHVSGLQYVTIMCLLAVLKKNVSQGTGKSVDKKGMSVKVIEIYQCTMFSGDCFKYDMLLIYALMYVVTKFLLQLYTVFLFF